MIKKIAAIVFAVVLIAICVNMFLGPHEIAAGGLTGLAIILEQMGVARGFTIAAGNALVLVLALVFLGREAFVNTIIGAGLLPIAVAIIPRFMLIQDRMLAMAVGSVIFGIAVAIMYAHNASSGGTAVPPLILKKKFNLSPAIGLFIADGIVVTLCLLVFDVDSFFFAIVSIFITSATMSYIENGISKKKMVYVISKQHEQITREIMDKIGRGVTLIPVTGAYERDKKPMLMVTLAAKDYQGLKQIVDAHDREAFMITDTVSDVHGRGFSYDSASV
jgi:uncharacterized membrane-anchored protein YitT (DUF2179 family)